MLSTMEESDDIPQSGVINVGHITTKFRKHRSSESHEAYTKGIHFNIQIAVTACWTINQAIDQALYNRTGALLENH